MSESCETWDYADLTDAEKLEFWKEQYYDLKLDYEDAEQGYNTLRKGLGDISHAIDNGTLDDIRTILVELGIRKHLPTESLLESKDELKETILPFKVGHYSESDANYYRRLKAYKSVDYSEDSSSQGPGLQKSYDDPAFARWNEEKGKFVDYGEDFH